MLHTSNAGFDVGDEIAARTWSYGAAVRTTRDTLLSGKCNANRWKRKNPANKSTCLITKKANLTKGADRRGQRGSRSASDGRVGTIIEHPVLQRIAPLSCLNLMFSGANQSRSETIESSVALSLVRIPPVLFIFERWDGGIFAKSSQSRRSHNRNVGRWADSG